VHKRLMALARRAVPTLGFTLDFMGPSGAAGDDLARHDPTRMSPGRAALPTPT